MSLSARTRMSCRAAGSMFSRLATLRLLPRTRRIDDERDVGGGEVADQVAGGFERPVFRVVDPEHDLNRWLNRWLNAGRTARLNRRVVLLDKRAQVFIKPGLGAVQRLQDRNRCRLHCRRQRPARKAQRGDQLGRRGTASRCRAQKRLAMSGSSDPLRSSAGKRMAPAGVPITEPGDGAAGAGCQWRGHCNWWRRGGAYI